MNMKVESNEVWTILGLEHGGDSVVMQEDFQSEEEVINRVKSLIKDQNGRKYYIHYYNTKEGKELYLNTIKPNYLGTYYHDSLCFSWN